MLNVVLGFGGRLGRLNYLLLTLLLGAFLTFVIFTIGFTAFSRLGGGAFEGDGRSWMLVAVVVTVPVYWWFTLALTAKRFRDMGWDPFVMIVGWGALAALDFIATGYVPARLVAIDGTSTVFGGLASLCLIGCLLFWPSAVGEERSRLDGTPYTSRVEALVAGGSVGAIRGAFGRR